MRDVIDSVKIECGKREAPTMYSITE